MSLVFRKLLEKKINELLKQMLFQPASSSENLGGVGISRNAIRIVGKEPRGGSGHVPKGQVDLTSRSEIIRVLDAVRELDKFYGMIPELKSLEYILEQFLTYTANPNVEIPDRDPEGMEIKDKDID